MSQETAAFRSRNRRSSAQTRARHHCLCDLRADYDVPAVSARKSAFLALGGGYSSQTSRVRVYGNAGGVVCVCRAFVLAHFPTELGSITCSVQRYLGFDRAGVLSEFHEHAALRRSSQSHSSAVGIS